MLDMAIASPARYGGSSGASWQWTKTFLFPKITGPLWINCSMTVWGIKLIKPCEFVLLCRVWIRPQSAKRTINFRLRHPNNRSASNNLLWSIEVNDLFEMMLAIWTHPSIWATGKFVLKSFIFLRVFQSDISWSKTLNLIWGILVLCLPNNLCSQIIGPQGKGVMGPPLIPQLQWIFFSVTSGQNSNKINFEAWEQCPDGKLCTSCAQLYAR